MRSSPFTTGATNAVHSPDDGCSLVPIPQVRSNSTVPSYAGFLDARVLFAPLRLDLAAMRLTFQATCPCGGHLYTGKDPHLAYSAGILKKCTSPGFYVVNDLTTRPLVDFELALLTQEAQEFVLRFYKPGRWYVFYGCLVKFQGLLEDGFDFRNRDMASPISLPAVTRRCLWSRYYHILFDLHYGGY